MLGLRTSELTYTRAEDNGGQEKLSFIVSTEAPATDGGILRAKGVDLTRFKENPIMLYGHDDGNSAMYGGKSLTGGLPVGRAAATTIVDSKLGKKTAIQQDVVPALQPDQDGELAKTFRFIWSLVRDNFLRMVSVRYRVTEYEQRTAEQLESLGLPPWGFVARRWMLWETSLVSIGADAGAMMKRAWESGKYENDDLDRLVRLARPEPIIIGERGEEADDEPADLEVKTESATADPDLSASIRALSETISGFGKAVAENTAEVRRMRQDHRDLMDELTDDEDDDSSRAVDEQVDTEAEPGEEPDAEATRSEEVNEALAVFDAAGDRLRAALAKLNKKES